MMTATETRHDASTLARPARVAPLEWQRLGGGHYRAEPLPGLEYRIAPAPDGVGVEFAVPGHPPAGAMRASIARAACEQHWQKRLGPKVVETAAKYIKQHMTVT